ncbi:FAD-binding oxidoreductase [soil metagenome]
MTTTSTHIPGFTGLIITPGDAGYDDARRVWNVMHDKRPAIIARCTSPADVAAAIAFAVENDVRIAIRGGGHSLPGLSVVDDGIVIDLGLMNAVSVDPATRRAIVQGGALLGDLDAAAQKHGLVVPAGVISHTGVAGLTLGGGVGRLMRRFGLTIDSLVSAEIVTADGRMLHADASENADLFWAIRGGGGNFGVVTSFEFGLHELSDLLILATFNPLEDAHRLLELAEKTMADEAPRELLWTSFIRKGPQRPWLPAEFVGQPGVMSVIEWSGDPDDGRAVLEDIRRELAPVGGSIDLVPFAVIQRAGDEDFGPGLMSYVKATFGSAITPQLIDVLIERGRLLRSPLTQVELLSMGGTISDVSPNDTAFPHRNAAWLLNVPASWRDAADSDYEIAWVRDTFAAIAPLSSGGAYSNFMEGDEEANDEVAYGATLARLRAVKSTYDPTNVFRLNQNVLPLDVPLTAP